MSAEAAQVLEKTATQNAYAMVKAALKRLDAIDDSVADLQTLARDLQEKSQRIDRLMTCARLDLKAAAAHLMSDLA